MAGFWGWQPGQSMRCDGILRRLAEREDAPPLVQRADDREDVIENRLKVYARQTEPLVEHYKSRGLLKVVNADQPVDRVYEEFVRAAGG